MDTGIMIALILGAASIVSSISFGLIPGIRRGKLDRMETKIHKMAQNIDSFYAIEQSLLEQLSNVTGKKVKTLKDETRKQVRIEKGRPLSDYATPSGIASEL